MIYLRARYYNPELGRFIQIDTYKGEQDHVESQNRYVYTINNPYKYTDPSGHLFVGRPSGLPNLSTNDTAKAAIDNQINQMNKQTEKKILDQSIENIHGELYVMTTYTEGAPSFEKYGRDSNGDYQLVDRQGSIYVSSPLIIPCPPEEKKDDGSWWDNVVNTVVDTVVDVGWALLETLASSIPYGKEILELCKSGKISILFELIGAVLSGLFDLFVGIGAMILEFIIGLIPFISGMYLLYTSGAGSSLVGSLDISERWWNAIYGGISLIFDCLTGGFATTVAVTETISKFVKGNKYINAIKMVAETGITHYTKNVELCMRIGSVLGYSSFIKDIVSALLNGVNSIFDALSLIVNVVWEVAGIT